MQALRLSEASGFAWLTVGLMFEALRIICPVFTSCRSPTDPAAEAFNYPVSIDIRDLVSLEDVMTELELGPNG